MCAELLNAIRKFSFLQFTKNIVLGLTPIEGRKIRALVAEVVLPDVPYVQLLFTIPKILRKGFLFKRELYGELCRAGYRATRDFFREHFPRLQEPVPAFIATPPSFGSLLNPHAHVSLRSGARAARRTARGARRTTIMKNLRKKAPLYPRDVRRGCGSSRQFGCRIRRCARSAACPFGECA